MARKRTLTAEWLEVLSIGHNLLPFTGNGEVSIRVKYSGVGQNIPKKQISSKSTESSKYPFVVDGLP